MVLVPTIYDNDFILHIVIPDSEMDRIAEYETFCFRHQNATRAVRTSSVFHGLGAEFLLKPTSSQWSAMNAGDPVPPITRLILIENGVELDPHFERKLTKGPAILIDLTDDIEPLPHDNEIHFANMGKTRLKVRFEHSDIGALICRIREWRTELLRIEW